MNLKTKLLPNFNVLFGYGEIVRAENRFRKRDLSYINSAKTIRIPAIVSFQEGIRNPSPAAQSNILCQTFSDLEMHPLTPQANTTAPANANIVDVTICCQGPCMSKAGLYTKINGTI